MAARFRIFCPMLTLQNGILWLTSGTRVPVLCPCSVFGTKREETNDVCIFEGQSAASRKTRTLITMTGAAYAAALTAGGRLRQRRLFLQLSIRDVSHATRSIAANYDNDLFFLSSTRISELERDLTIPTVHKLFSLATVYSLSGHDLFQWYGIPAEMRNRILQI